MIHLKIDNSFLKSKVARRIFLIFLVCSMVPLIIISCFTYIFVGNELNDQAKTRLEQICKTKGLEIYERLLSLETELKIIVTKVKKGILQSSDLLLVDKKSYAQQRFDDLTIYKNGKYETLDSEKNETFQALSNLQMEHLLKGKALITNRKMPNSFAPIYMVSLLNPKQPDQGILYARINPLYLWGIGMEGAIPPEMEMLVIHPDQSILISSLSDFSINLRWLELIRQGPSSNPLEFEYQNQKYAGSYWSLFMKHQFFDQDWLIVFGQSKSSILEPVSGFATTFFLLVLLTFWVVLLFSIVSIRKRTVPIEKLRSGALKIADGEFGYQLDIRSNDEFESLCNTFNKMSLNLKESQALLVQAAKMSAFGQMAAGIVHEIGQPLSAIVGYTDLLLIDNPSVKQRKRLSTIQSQLERLSEIISKFRTFSRTSKEKMGPVSVNDLLSDVKNLLDHQVKMRRVKLIEEKSEVLPRISGDKNSLQQVFLNLIINAMDACEGRDRTSPEIKIKTYAVDNKVHIDIEDNGSGIPKEIKARIFEPFFTTKDEEKGTGLGLAIIDSVLHKHNATILVESEENKGTKFTIVFPQIPSAT